MKVKVHGSGCAAATDACSRSWVRSRWAKIGLSTDCPGMPGDNIYNGADDNATGCGILLELAHAFSAAT